MAAARARRPGLLTVDDPPRIVGHECRACGRQAFPPDPYGCERCGAPADELARLELPATGTIHAVAVVHRHHRPEPPTPFTVVTVVLDAGIALKGVVADGDGPPPVVGGAVEGVTVVGGVDDDGVGLLDLRFRTVAGGRLA